MAGENYKRRQQPASRTRRDHPVRGQTRDTARRQGGNRTRAQAEGLTREQLKRRNAAKRRKILRRQRRIFMIFAGIVLLFFLILLLRACGFFEERADATTMTLNGDGSITFEEVAGVEGASTDEVKAFIKEAIKSYNKEHKGRNVRLERIDEDDGVVYVRSYYKSAAVYAEFTELECFAGTLEEAEEAGYEISEVYAVVKDGKKGKTADINEVISDKSLSCLIVGQNIRTVLPTVPSYVTDNATSVEGNVVTINTGDEDALCTTIVIFDPDADKQDEDTKK